MRITGRAYGKETRAESGSLAGHTAIRGGEIPTKDSESRGSGLPRLRIPGPLLWLRPCMFCLYIKLVILAA